MFQHQTSRVDAMARWRVKKESEPWKSVPLNLDLGLAFLQMCACVTTAAPFATSESVYILGEVFISHRPGVPLGEFIEPVCAHTHADTNTHTHTLHG